MGKHAWTVVCLVVVSLSWPGRALPQTASPEALAAAKELMIVSKMTDQINLMIPAIMQQLKPLVTKGNPLIERDFDELMPVVLKMANARLDDFVNAGAGIYVRHFTADEIRQVTQFYRSPAGQKFLQKQPDVLKESMALGQRFGQAVAQDLQSHMAEELRKRGHHI